VEPDKRNQDPGEELAEAVTEYKKAMNEDYAKGGADVVTPNAANLDDE
jgi:hypothetical protein